MEGNTYYKLPISFTMRVLLQHFLQKVFIMLCYIRTRTVRLLLETHPELVGPYTAYGGAMYTHTPLHLASRNGHR